jgi:hypothetical protein
MAQSPARHSLRPSANWKPSHKNGTADCPAASACSTADGAQAIDQWRAVARGASTVEASS